MLDHSDVNSPSKKSAASVHAQGRATGGDKPGRAGGQIISHQSGKVKFLGGGESWLPRHHAPRGPF